MVNKNLEKFGRIDILVNNAGASFPLPTLQLSEGSWDAQWATALATPVVA